jgi:hypothetical protein
VKNKEIEAVALAAGHIAHLLEYMENCPFTTDGVYECMGVEVAECKQQIVALAAATGDEAIMETVNACVFEDDLGFNYEDNEVAFWVAVEEMAESK